MFQRSKMPLIWTGIWAGAAGILSGLLGGAGGMVLVPGLRRFAAVEDRAVFPTSVAIMLPAAAVTLLLSAKAQNASDALPYILSCSLGGLIAGKTGERIPRLWLHRIFGCILLLGAVRSLW